MSIGIDAAKILVNNEIKLSEKLIPYFLTEKKIKYIFLSSLTSLFFACFNHYLLCYTHLKILCSLQQIVSIKAKCRLQYSARKYISLILKAGVGNQYPKIFSAWCPVPIGPQNFFLAGTRYPAVPTSEISSVPGTQRSQSFEIFSVSGTQRYPRFLLFDGYRPVPKIFKF